MGNTQKNKPRRKPGKSRLPSHTVRTADGGTRTFARYGRKLAVSCHCTECCGFELDPAGCTSPLCPLFPYRARTLATKKGGK